MIQLSLPNGKYAYGRTLRDAGVSLYAEMSAVPGRPPIGSRDYLFTVGVYNDQVNTPEFPVVGHDPSLDEDDEWPPPSAIKDILTGKYRIYYKGLMRPSAGYEHEGLEIAAVWDMKQITERLMVMTEANDH